MGKGYIICIRRDNKSTVDNKRNMNRKSEKWEMIKERREGDYLQVGIDFLNSIDYSYRTL
jgi:hypothetical protein